MFIKAAAVVLGISFMSFAFAAIPTCKIQNVKDAQFCMNKLAALEPRYNLENDAFASKQVDMMARVLISVGQASQIKKIEKGDYVGVMFEYQDETHLRYYVIKKGTRVQPIELLNLNIADLAYLIRTPIHAKDFFLGQTKIDSDLMSDVQAALEDPQ